MWGTQRFVASRQRPATLAIVAVVGNGISTCNPHAGVPIVDETELGLGQLGKSTADRLEDRMQGRRVGAWVRLDTFSRGWASLIQSSADPSNWWVISWSDDFQLTVELHNSERSAHLSRDPSVLMRRTLLVRHGCYAYDGTHWRRATMPEDFPLIEDGESLTTDDFRYDPGIIEWRESRKRDQPGIVGCRTAELLPPNLVSYSEIAEFTGTADSTLRSAVSRESASLPERQATIGGRPVWSRLVISDHYSLVAAPLYDVVGEPAADWVASNDGVSKVQTTTIGVALEAPEMERLVSAHARLAKKAGLKLAERPGRYSTLEGMRGDVDYGDVYAAVWSTIVSRPTMEWPFRSGGAARRTF